MLFINSRPVHTVKDINDWYYSLPCGLDEPMFAYVDDLVVLLGPPQTLKTHVGVEVVLDNIVAQGLRH